VIANDTVTTPGVVAESDSGRSYAGNTRSATVASYHDDYAGSCGGAGASDAVYKRVVTSRRTVTLSTDGSDFATALYVKRVGTRSLVEVGCNAGSDGPSVLMLALEPGTYYVFVDGAGPGDEGHFELEVLF
jgi:hypothetical protein